ncbi:MAG: tRNA (guanosine(37)-N1)-methyltransferase TrmD [Minisyncoccia bacterium]
MAIRFDIITIFPEAFESYFNTSILKRAKKQGFIKIKIHNLRKWSEDRHQTIDDRPYGGGAGMIFLVKPIFKAVQEIKKKYKKGKKRVILFSLRGKKLAQNDLERLKKYKHLILICPHYEGVDERVAKYIADETISLGDYILTGGELPAMVLIDGITRLIKGVIKEDSLKEESFSKSLSQGEKDLYYEYPQYSRPEIFYPNLKNKKISWRVPRILLTGDHKKILEWRKKHQKKVRN